MAVNSYMAGIYIKQCTCMMQYDAVDIPPSMIEKKYVCFADVNTCSIKFAELLGEKTDKIPLFKKQDILRYELPYQFCEAIEEQDDILYLEQDNYNIFNTIGCYNEQKCLLEKAQRLRQENVKILIIDVPVLENLSRKLTADERLRVNKRIMGHIIPKEPGDETEVQLKKVYGEENYALYREGKIANLKQYYKGNECVLEDLKDEFANVSGGLRLTTDVPDFYENSIFFLGPCIIGGMYCKDRETIPSVVQRMLNRKYLQEYRCVNYGTCGFYRSYLEKLDKLLIRRGDLIVIIDCFNDIKNNQRELYDQQIDVDLTKFFDETQGDLFFESPVHLGARGNQAVAKYIYPYIEHLCENKEKRTTVVKDARKRLHEEYPDIDLHLYEEEAERLDKKYGLLKKQNGAIVMNCNPFTNGHKYLIETTRQLVDFLIVFVVEEDSSFFKFKDRKRMVELGTQEYENVIVLSSGSYVLSNLTMPEYFNKEVLQDATIDPVKDVELFAQDIAPIFHILYRFVGNEPIDKVTAQYNRAIKEICPQYGITVKEIARKCVGGVISASNVRKLLEAGEYVEVQKLVPKTTWEYLRSIM